MAKVLLLLALVLALAAHQAGAHRTLKQAAPVPSPANASNEFLDAHNKARAEVGVEPLKWSEKLAKDTSLLVRYQRDKKGCEFADLTPGKYGANQLLGSGVKWTPRLAVEAWVAEKMYYNHANNSCETGRKCGVYTQVVWGKSAELGCALAACPKQQLSLTICFYDPPGNVAGESPY
ncbi:hypothetical protein NMG60_11008053 [Bertholletia excelsa]